MKSQWDLSLEHIRPYRAGSAWRKAAIFVKNAAGGRFYKERPFVHIEIAGEPLKAVRLITLHSGVITKSSLDEVIGP